MLRRFALTALAYPVGIATAVTVAFLAAPGMAERPTHGPLDARYAVLSQGPGSCPALADHASSRCPVLAAAAAGCPGARAMVAVEARDAARCPALAGERRAERPVCPGLAAGESAPRVSPPPARCPFGGSGPVAPPKGLLTAESDAGVALPPAA